MFKLNNVGKKLYFSVLAVFLVFAVSFIVFQQTREKQYKISTLTLKLANYNELLAEDLELSKTGGILLSDSVEVVDSVRVAEAKLEDFVQTHESKDLRVTLVKKDGTVIFDNMSKDYRHFANHAQRAEIAQALKEGMGTSVERQSKTLKQDYFYVASYFPKSHLIVRTALPYNDDLTKSLQLISIISGLPWQPSSYLPWCYTVLQTDWRRMYPNSVSLLIRRIIMRAWRWRIWLSSLMMSWVRLPSESSRCTSVFRQRVRSRIS